MKSFRTFLQEGVARKEHSTANLHTLQSAGSRKLVFANTEMVGYIDFHVGVPEIIPGDKDRYLAYINAAYRDSRLKINRPTSRIVGEFPSEQAAVEGIRAALANLRK